MCPNSWWLGPFTKMHGANPCLSPSETSAFHCPLGGPLAWEAKDVFNPAAVAFEGQVHLLYRAEDHIGSFLGTSRVGLATSQDGLSFTRHPEPVLYPDRDVMQALEWDGGIEDPRIAQRDDGLFVLTYTAFDCHMARLAVATSRDLRTWVKHGVAFKRRPNLWSKSGAIVCRVQGDSLIAERIGGKYWMYWGESSIYAATSDDLISWTLVEANIEGDLRHQPLGKGLAPVLRPRRGRFDSNLVEPGPPAVITENGIVLIYNARNDEETGDPSFAPGAYCAGQALLDPLDPTIVIGRATEPFFRPETPFEMAGQVGPTTFVEGLVPFKGQWFLYYGTADSHIAVATAPMVAHA